MSLNIRATSGIALAIACPLANATPPADGAVAWRKVGPGDYYGNVVADYDRPIAKTFNVVLPGGANIVVYEDRSLFGVNADLQMIKIDKNGLADPLFGGNGYFSHPAIRIQAAALSSDGKLLVVDRLDEYKEHYSVCAYSSTTGSQVALSAKMQCAELDLDLDHKSNIYDLQFVVQPDGKFLLAGSGETYVNGYVNRIYVARFNADGTPDSDYGSQGVVLQPASTQSFFADAKLTSNGKLVLVGGGGYNPPAKLASISRFSASGVQDLARSVLPSWNWPSNYTSEFVAVELVDDPTSVEDDIVGLATIEGGNNEKSLLTRIDGTSGEPDALFGTSNGYTVLTYVARNKSSLRSRSGGGWIVASGCLQGLRWNGTLDADFAYGGLYCDIPQPDSGWWSADGEIDSLKIVGNAIYVSGAVYQMKYDPFPPPPDPMPASNDYSVCAVGMKLTLDRIFKDGFEQP